MVNSSSFRNESTYQKMTASNEAQVSLMN